MNYVLQIDLFGADKAGAQIDALNQKKDKLTNSSSMDEAWSKFQKVDQISKSITAGKTGFSDVGDGAEKASGKILKSFSVLDAWGKSVFKSLKDASGLMKSWDDAVSFGGGNSVLDAWRKQMESVVPKVDVYDPNKANKNAFGREGPDQKASDEFGVGGVLARGRLPKTESELSSDKEAKIKREATEAKRYDLMQKDAQSAMIDRSKFYKDLTFLMMPLLNPGSVWATLFSSRQTFSAMMTKTGQADLQGMGMKGGIGSAAGVTAGLVAITTAAGIAINALTYAFSRAAEEIGRSIDYARKLYAESLTQGLSTSFLARRNIAADVLGVDTKDVMRMQQMGYVTQKLRSAIEQISSSAPKLEFVSVQFKIMEYNWLAAMSSVGTQFAPFLNAFAAFGTMLAKFTPALSEVAIVMARGSILGNIGHFLGFDYNKMMGSALANPASYMKQLPASHWEKMGLVIGGGSHSQVPTLIRQTNAHLKNIYDIFKGKNGKPVSPNFGMSPNVSNP